MIQPSFNETNSSTHFPGPVLLGLCAVLLSRSLSVLKSPSLCLCCPPRSYIRSPLCQKAFLGRLTPSRPHPQPPDCTLMQVNLTLITRGPGGQTRPF